MTIITDGNYHYYYYHFYDDFDCDDYDRVFFVFQKADPIFGNSNKKKETKKADSLGFESKLGENVNFVDDFSDLSEVCLFLKIIF